MDENKKTYDTKVCFFIVKFLVILGNIYDLFSHTGGHPMTKKGHIYDLKIILNDDQFMTY